MAIFYVSLQNCVLLLVEILSILKKVEPSELGKEIHEKIPRKSPEPIQVILNQTEDATGNRIMIADNYIGGWLPTGLFLTSAGVNRQGTDKAAVFPKKL